MYDLCQHGKFFGTNTDMKVLVPFRHASTKISITLYVVDALLFSPSSLQASNRLRCLVFTMRSLLDGAFDARCSTSASLGAHSKVQITSSPKCMFKCLLCNSTGWNCKVPIPTGNSWRQREAPRCAGGMVS